jgi:RNA polymerase sigma factor (sigma-70 family)
VARVGSGDDQAFEEIFDRYGSGLLGFCVHMLGSRESGEDALQLTMVAAYVALRRGACDGALRPWLYAIARNRCLSELRAPREIPDGDWVSADRPAMDGPASVVARREQLREIVEDLHRLPADQRAALVMFELGGQSHAEIATVLGVRRGKVKALIFQAREGLHRGRSARESACFEVREQLANGRGKVPARGALRAHIDRCAPCQEFAREVRRQRAALALVLPVALGGKLKALVLSSATSHGGSSGMAATGAGGAGSVSAAGTALGGGTVSTAAGTAAPTMVASALGTDAVVGGSALTSSISLATLAKLAAVVVVALGVGEAVRSILAPSPRPHVSSIAGQPKHATTLGSPLRPLASGITNPLTQPGSLGGAGALPAGAVTASGSPFSRRTPGALPSGATFLGSSSGALGSHGTVGGKGGGAGQHGTTGGTGGGGGKHGTTGGSGGGAGQHGTTGGTGGGGGKHGTTGGAGGGPGSHGTTGGAGGGPGSHGTTGGTGGGPGNHGTGSSGGTGSGSTGHGHSPGGPPGRGVGHSRGIGHARGIGPSHGNGPPRMPPGCVGNPSPGCVKKLSRF